MFIRCLENAERCCNQVSKFWLPRNPNFRLTKKVILWFAWLASHRLLWSQLRSLSQRKKTESRVAPPRKPINVIQMNSDIDDQWHDDRVRKTVACYHQNILQDAIDHKYPHGHRTATCLTSIHPDCHLEKRPRPLMPWLCYRAKRKTLSKLKAKRCNIGEQIPILRLPIHRIAKFRADGISLVRVSVQWCQGVIDWEHQHEYLTQRSLEPT